MAVNLSYPDCWDSDNKAHQLFREVLVCSDADLEGAVLDMAQQAESVDVLWPSTDTRLACGGVALNAWMAAKCIRDWKRTAVFARGLYDCAVAKSTEREGKPLEVLYLGSGPFGTLALPTMAVMPSDKVSFTFVDMHINAIQCLGKLVRKFGFENHCRRVVVGDASEWDFGDQRFDIVLTETMMSGMMNEPQYYVMENGQRFLAEGGVMLPERVSVGLEYRAGGVDGKMDDLWVYGRDRKDGADIELRMDLEREAVIERFTVTTDVVVHGRHRLGAGESEMTSPVEIKLPEGFRAKTLALRYRCGASAMPGAKSERI